MRRTALPLTGLLLVGGTVWAPVPAWADGSIVAPVAGAAYTGDTVVRIEAEVAPRSAATQLRLVDPVGVSRTVDSTGPGLDAQTLGFALDTACPEYPGSVCAGRRPAPNGTWTVQLTGGATGSRTFLLRVAPRAPSDVRAEATGPREVVVTWRRGTEPDLRGHDVVDGDGRVLADGDDDCPTGTCRTVVRDDGDGPVTSVVAVRAVRAACPGCAEDVTATSEVVAVDRPAPPPEPGAGPVEEPPVGGGLPDGGAGQATGGPPSEGPGSGAGAGTATPDSTSGPDAGPGPGGGSGAGADGPGTDRPDATGAGTGGLPSPGATTGSGRGLVLDAPASGAGLDGFSGDAFAPGSGLPGLPTPSGGGIALPRVAPAEDGGFARALPFEAGDGREQVAAGPVARVGGVVTDAVGSAVDAGRSARSLAAALLLLLAGAHLRLWLVQGAAPR